MTKITDWSAARSGPAITITYQTNTGEAAKLTDVRLILPVEGAPGSIEAITKNGDVHRLDCR